MNEPQKTHIFIGADHGGFAYKEFLLSFIAELGYTVTDCGAAVLNPTDDYPDLAQVVALQVVAHQDSFGILLCRTGAGMCIAANKIAGIRAVCTTSIETTQLAREHNHANILALGADELTVEQAKELVKIFLQTTISLDERHVRRIQKIHSLEN